MSKLMGKLTWKVLGVWLPILDNLLPMLYTTWMNKKEHRDI